MLFKGTIVGPASGKLNGIVASHNAGGQYFRTLAIPTDPGTPAQTAIRNAVTNLSNRWNTTLTQAQRDAWDTYGAQVSFLNRLGDPVNLSGISNYIRSNVSRIQGPGLARIDTAPVIFNTGILTEPVVTASQATQQVSVAFDVSDPWVNQTGAGLLVYVSRPQNPGVNFFKGPYRLAGVILGDTATPPTSPQTLPAPFPFVQAQALFTQSRATLADARLTGRIRTRLVAAA